MALENLPPIDKFLMDSGERLRSEVAREVERARQNIEDIRAIEKPLSLNVAKSRALLAEAARMELLFRSNRLKYKL